MPHQVFDSPLFGVTVNEYPSRLPYPTPELPAFQKIETLLPGIAAFWHADDS